MDGRFGPAPSRLEQQNEEFITSLSIVLNKLETGKEGSRPTSCCMGNSPRVPCSVQAQPLGKAAAKQNEIIIH